MSRQLQVGDRVRVIQSGDMYEGEVGCVAAVFRNGYAKVRFGRDEEGAYRLGHLRAAACGSDFVEHLRQCIKACTAFRVGDLVALPSSIGCRMTVVGTEKPGLVSVCWHSQNGELQTADLSPDVLCRWE